MIDALLECMQKREEEGTPSASAEGAPKTPWRTPPPTFAELATPQTAMATAGWQELYDEDSVNAGLSALLHMAAFLPRASFYEAPATLHGHIGWPASICLSGQSCMATALMEAPACSEPGTAPLRRFTESMSTLACREQSVPRAEGGEAADGKPEEAKEWVDDGSLPLEDGDKLPFFLLDAHEELANPGTLYLFGKARLMIGPLLCSRMGCSAGTSACLLHWTSVLSETAIPMSDL